MARYYDQFNRFVPYKEESAFIKWAIDKYKKSSGRELLDVCCGTGSYLVYLREHFHVQGIDISKEMIGEAKKKLPGVKLGIGSMAAFRLPEKFDAILCRGAMDYNFSYKEVDRTIANFVRHLKPGGVLLFTFEDAKDNFLGGTNIRLATGSGYKIVEISTLREGKEVSYWTPIYFVQAKNKLEMIPDPQKQGLFEVAKVKRIMEKHRLKSVVYSGLSSKKLWSIKVRKHPTYVGVLKW